MGDLATVTKLSTRHSWDKQPRLDDPTRHVYTCRKCRIRKRSEPDGRGWVELWRTADGIEGEGEVPACTGPAGAEPEPMAETPDTEVTPSAGALSCRVCPPPCANEAHPHLFGPACSNGVAAVGAARDRYWAESVLGVRAGGAA